METGGQIASTRSKNGMTSPKVAFDQRYCDIGEIQFNNIEDAPVKQPR